MSRILLSLAVNLAVAPVAMAQSSHSHTSGMSHDGDVRSVLTEPGQGAFAALAEVVRVLEADPETDWTRVDLAGLRAHLVDMDLLVSGADAEEIAVTGGLRIVVSGQGAAREAIARMVPTHAVELRNDTSWQVLVENAPDAVILTVTSDIPEVTARIRGLGFFGLMASQDHHRAHHLAIARGDPSHGH